MHTLSPIDIVYIFQTINLPELFSFIIYLFGDGECKSAELANGQVNLTCMRFVHFPNCFIFFLFQMVKMMIVVVIIYAVCWLPIHAVTLIEEGHPDIYDFKHYQVIWISAHWLAMSYACYNPIVYFWMNKRFRVGFKGLLACCRGCKTSVLQADTSIRINVPAHSYSHSSSRFSLKNSMDDLCTRPVNFTQLHKGEKV